MTAMPLQIAGALGVALMVYHLAPARARNGLLLAASYAFYIWLAPQFVFVLAGVTLVSFVVGARVQPARPRRAAWMWAGVGMNLGCLLLVRAIYPINPFTEPFAVIGVSFYTLQSISYLVDLYSGHLRTRGSLTEVAVYLAYFPKLLAGPIERAPVFFERLRRPLPVDDDAVARAFTLIAIGMTRKVAIADPLRQLLPPAAFTAPHELGAASLAAALIVFAIVLYNDFAGYTQIMRGVSLLFGIELSPNFAQPYFATSFTDFWNRWHITLSHWLRDYIYLPLSRTLLRRDPRLWNVSNLVLPPLVTMLASGLWHGGSWHMLIWGALHGLFLIAERMIALLRRPAPGATPSRLTSLFLAVFVLLAGVSAFSFFRMDVVTAVAFWRHLVAAPLGELPSAAYVVFVVPSFWLDWIQSRHGDATAFFHWPRPVRAALLAIALILWFLLSRATAPAPFIYRGF